jgi:protein-S-isoprenylcysteine O-methyltransferase Ste14
MFFAAAPAVVAGIVPLALHSQSAAGKPSLAAQAAGLTLIVAGTATLVHAFVRFVSEGPGTPAPIAPTETLVVGGLYRWVRNPMYLAVTAAIFGQALLFGQWILAGYALAAWGVMASFVHWVEEPALTGRYGDQYVAYCRAVHAWWPRRPTSPRIGTHLSS